MTVIDELRVPLVAGDGVSSSLFTVAVTNPLNSACTGQEHNSNPEGHDPEGTGRTRWMWGEVRQQLWLSGPIIGMYLLQNTMVLAGSMFVGHLGSLPLAAFSLANAFTSMTGFTLMAGMACALETLCGQAHGAKQYHLLGIFLQRAIVFLTLAALPIGLVWLNMGRILVAVGEDPLVARTAQSYTYWIFPNLFSYSVLYPLIKFFQTQGAVLQLLLSFAVGTLLVHIPLCWLVIDKLHFGLNGAAIAWDIAIPVNVCLLLAFIRFSPRFQKTFTLSREAFQDFGQFSGYAVASASMICMEMWYIEILTLLVGLLPNSQLNISSFAICMGLLTLSNIISVALGVATSVRVSNELGAGKARAARAVVAVAVVTAVVHGTVMASCIFALRRTWGWAFTNDEEVVHHVARTAPFLAVLALLYAIGAILSGVVRGIGWQRAGAMANLGAFYAVGLPVALVSVFVFKLDARGLWLGMGCGLVTQIAALIFLILCPEWEQLAQEASLRTHSFNSRLPTLAPFLKPTQEEDHSREDLQKLST